MLGKHRFLSLRIAVSWLCDAPSCNPDCRFKTLTGGFFEVFFAFARACTADGESSVGVSFPAALVGAVVSSTNLGVTAVFGLETSTGALEDSDKDDPSVGRVVTPTV